MAFIRRKVNATGSVTYHVVRTFREGSRVRHQTICTLGYNPTIADRLEELQEEIDVYNEAVEMMPRMKLDRRFAQHYLDARQQQRELAEIQKATGLP